jgi:hypothetical protein
VGKLLVMMSKNKIEADCLVSFSQNLLLTSNISVGSLLDKYRKVFMKTLTGRVNPKGIFIL